MAPVWEVPGHHLVRTPGQGLPEVTMGCPAGGSVLPGPVHSKAAAVSVTAAHWDSFPCPCVRHCWAPAGNKMLPGLVKYPVILPGVTRRAGETASSYTRQGLGWILEKNVFTERVEQAAQGWSQHPGSVQKTSGCGTWDMGWW